MALFCPNINSPEYKKLLSAVDGNSNLAYYYWNKFEGNLPDDFYTNTQQADTQEVVKEGVDFVFNQNPELSNIGTPQQYSKYLDSVFPNSKVKDIVHHTSNKKFEVFKKQDVQDLVYDRDEGIYFSKDPNYYTKGGIKYSVLLDIKNPTNISHSDFITALDGSGIRAKDFEGDADGYTTYSTPVNEFYQGKDNFYIGSDLYTILSPESEEDAEFGDIYLKNNTAIPETEYLSAYKLFQKNQSPELKFAVVFEPEQIHILSSKKDLEMFRNFINFTKSEYAKYGDIQQFKDYIMSKNFAAIEEFLVVNNKIDRKC